ncbi:MAG: gltX [Alphaproteobacteria bacterium]|nr:gltX [Alphaproteobacteria bacterium]
MSVTVRFAPSPTGTLHIGGGRTALFNYYFAKHHGGKYLLRIEDTDRERSTPEAVDAIINGLAWLGVVADEPPVFQLQRIARHTEIAHELVKRGQAYYCYMTGEEIETERNTAESEGQIWHYDRRWRDYDPTLPPPRNVPPAIRIKAPLGDGMVAVDDAVKGRVELAFDQMDDFILLRADGTPTYMLAVVVDDHDMGISHIIRGNEHFVNAFRQNVIHLAMGWTPPVYAHVPLIHGEDGKKLSKRTGAASIEEYRDLGYLPEAMRNYLLRLGWSHGDEEIIDDGKAIELFTLEGIGKSPSQWDFQKLNFINHHYMKLRDNNELYELMKPFLQERYGDIWPDVKERLLKGFNGLKERSQTLIQLADNARFYVQFPLPMDDGAREKLAQPHATNVLQAALEIAPLFGTEEWDGKTILTAIQEQTGFKMGQVGPVLRAALTGTMQSPDLTELITALGADEFKKRLDMVR